MSIRPTKGSAAFAGVFVQSNEQGTNNVLAFRRDESGALKLVGEHPTGPAATWGLRQLSRHEIARRSGQAT